ncbi:MAG TPA: hypothetical protein VFQ45_05425 [Longimicrobium sp.]|nr:hypothetical protein [Longimicrobium sp.]
MDPAFLIPVLALVTGLIAVIKMPRRAFLSPGHDDAAAEIAALRQENAALQDENAALQRQLTEAQDRSEFMERLLQAQPATPALPPSPASPTAPGDAAS